MFNLKKMLKKLLSLTTATLLLFAYTKELAVLTSSVNTDMEYIYTTFEEHEPFKFIPEYPFNEYIGDLTEYFEEDYSDINISDHFKTATNNLDLQSEPEFLTSGDYTYTITDEGKATIVYYSGYETDIVIPSRIDSYEVIAIESAFVGSNLQSIEIPYGIQYIGDYAFGECSDLTSITIFGDQLTISYAAFAFCTSLETVIIYGDVTEIKASAFYDCTSLKSIEIYGNIKTIDSVIVNQCSNLDFILINGNIDQISSSAFQNSGIKNIKVIGDIKTISSMIVNQCDNLDSIIINGNINKVSSSAFSNSSIKEFVVNGDIQIIDSAIVYQCNELESILINGNINEIYPSAFAESSLINLNVIGNIQVIGSSVVNKCDNLNSILIDGSINEISSTAFANSGIEHFSVTGDVQIIKPGIFYNCMKLKTVEFGGNINQIMPSAFTDNSMEEFQVNGNIEIIESAAFSNGYDSPTVIKTIKVGGNIGSIGNGAFLGCKVSNFYISGNIGTIGAASFSSMKADSFTIQGKIDEIGTSSFSLSEVNGFNIKGNVGTIKEAAFAQSNISEMSFNGNIDYIGNSAFIDSGITGINIKGDIGYIDTAAFANCKSLNNIKSSEGVIKFIGNSAFAESSILTFPKVQGVISESAFRNCENITELVIPASVTYIGNATFSGCNNLKTVIFENGENPIEMSHTVFSECASLENVEFSNRINSLGSGVFYNCKNLKSVTFSSDISEVGSGCFMNCTNLENVNFGGDIGVIGQNAFAFSGLRNISFPGDIEKIGRMAFYECLSLQNVDFFGDVDIIEERAFANSGLENITFGKNLDYLGEMAFMGCRRLKHIDIPIGIENIEALTFTDCESLSEITFSNRINRISSEAFKGCSSLTAAYFQGTKPDIDSNSIFNGTSDEFIIYYNSGFADKWEGYSDYPLQPYEPFFTDGDWQYSIDDEGYACIENYVGAAGSDSTPPSSTSGEKSYKVTAYKYEGSADLKYEKIIDDNYILIEKYAFANCENMPGIVLPETLKTIEERAFKNCKSLTKVVIPANVKSIGTKAFFGCDKLKEIYFEGPMPKFGKNVFASISSTLTIYYNSNYEDSWKNFAEVMKVKVLSKDETDDDDKGDVSKETKYKLEPLNGFDITVNAYPVTNNAKGFGYTAGYKISFDRYQEVFNNVSQDKYDAIPSWNGNCFGMSVTSIMLNDGRITLSDYIPGDLKLSDSGYSTINKKVSPNRISLSVDSKLTQLIEQYQIAIKSKNNKKQGKEKGVSFYKIIGDSDEKNNTPINCRAIIDYLSSFEEITPYIVMVFWNGGGHALVTDTTRKPQKQSDGFYKIYLYDPNNPYYSGGDTTDLAYNYVNKNGNRYLYMNPKTGIWKISAGFTSDAETVILTNELDEETAQENKNKDRLVFRDYNNIPKDFSVKQEYNWNSSE